MHKKVIIFLLTLVLTVTSISCTNSTNTTTELFPLTSITTSYTIYNTSSTYAEFNIIECPFAVYIGRFITVKARVTNYSATTDFNLRLEQAVEGATNIIRILYSGYCEADSNDTIIWYFQIPEKAYRGIANISIVADEGAGEIFKSNIIIYD
ncbi:MAG: hypothetical protein ACOWWR_10815 [Eubacteriales bacterium]